MEAFSLFFKGAFICLSVHSSVRISISPATDVSWHFLNTPDFLSDLLILIFFDVMDFLWNLLLLLVVKVIFFLNFFVNW